MLQKLNMPNLIVFSRLKHSMLYSSVNKTALILQNPGKGRLALRVIQATTPVLFPTYNTIKLVGWERGVGKVAILNMP